MRVAVVGASGKSGMHLVRTATSRGHSVSAICRTPSRAKVERLREEVRADAILDVHTADVISDPELLVTALTGCDAVVAIPITVRALRAPALVENLHDAMRAHGIRRAIHTAGEVTVIRNPGERYTPRQWLLRTLVPPLLAVTPYSMTEMLRASALIRASDTDWTIARAPTLDESAPRGYRFCAVHEVTGRHVLSRADYAAAMLDLAESNDSAGRAVTVIPADG